jgi:hypothetical protein
MAQDRDAIRLTDESFGAMINLTAAVMALK